MSYVVVRRFVASGFGGGLVPRRLLPHCSYRDHPQGVIDDQEWSVSPPSHLPSR
ncbi:MAG TPA: hypothetical protein VGC11_04780 [Acidimicrobiia bacterium]